LLLKFSRSDYAKARSAYNGLNYVIITQGIQRPQIAAIWRNHTLSWEKLQAVDRHVNTFEAKLALPDCWKKSDTEYIEAVDKAKLRK
jgi:hypothetical protein